MSNSEHFHSNVDSREYRINYSFNCDSSNVVYLLECTVCGVQYVGSTCTPFRLRFNNYKACNRKLNSGASVPQAEFFRHFTEEGHRGFLKDISVKMIDRLTGGNRMRESFWQYRLDCFAPCYIFQLRLIASLSKLVRNYFTHPSDLYAILQLSPVNYSMQLKINVKDMFGGYVRQDISPRGKCDNKNDNDNYDQLNAIKYSAI